MVDQVKPVRLQLSRRKGFDLQALSQATNGLTAISVARPGRWGNPYHGDGADYDHAYVVGLYREHLNRPDQAAERREIKAELRMANLACWCKPGDACHADVLLEIANG